RMASEDARTIVAERWDLHNAETIYNADAKCRVSVHRLKNGRNCSPISTTNAAPVTVPSPMTNRTVRAIESSMRVNVYGRHAITMSANTTSPTIRSTKTE